jgi:hypothetical protein
LQKTSFDNDVESVEEDRLTEPWLTIPDKNAMPKDDYLLRCRNHELGIFYPKILGTDAVLSCRRNMYGPLANMKGSPRIRLA